jgi:protein-S-isoprenylcysteine O-methyltransferase Ste14
MGGIGRPWIPDLLGAAALLGVLFVSETAPAQPDLLVRTLGGLVSLLALPFIFLPFHRLSRDGAVPAGASYMETTRVVDTGIYSIVRHPQYVGYCLLLVGLAIRRQSLAALLLGAVALTLFGLQMAREEKFLAARFGDAYAEYAARVPRWNFVAGVVRRLRRGGGTST